MSPVSTIDPPQGASVPVVEPPVDEKSRSVRILTPPDVDPEMVVEEIPPFPVRPITVEQFWYLVNVGFFGTARVEMLDGFVVDKMPHGLLACTIIEILTELLRIALPHSISLRCQLPIRLETSAPEPDFAVSVGPAVRYRERGMPPTPSDIFVVIEVSDSTLAKDRGHKLRTYARNGIREYWLVNCVDKQIEIYTEPTTQDGPPRFGTKTEVHLGETATMRVDGQAPIEIPLTMLFGE